ncbi:unnamed protein product [Pedinophyceae sp. YPF-701]|nr:unnamed protein product [Pedinophyceae sp. YPF-701]
MFRKGGKTTAINSGGRKKMHTTFDDGSELVEEYDMTTDELLVRKWRRKTPLGKLQNWEFLVGDAEPTAAAGGELRESSSAPTFHRRDTRGMFQWRIRNLPFPAEVYSVTVDESDRKIVVRTSNKKYYKRFAIPDLDLLQLPLEQSRVQWEWANSTLVISYAKPRAVVDAEDQDRAERAKMRAQEDGDVDCKTQ